MMRLVAGLALTSAFETGAAQAAVGLPGAAVPAGAASPAPTRVEYFCSPGFEPSYGGTCVAVPARAEIELFVDQPLYETRTVRRVIRHHRYRHGLRERF